MEEKEFICFFSDTIFRIDVLGQSVGCLFLILLTTLVEMLVYSRRDRVQRIIKLVKVLITYYYSVY